MPKIESDTKEKILVAARKVFHTHGFRGTRTTLIATEAGISRTMLHYYYSTKEALFQEVLTETMNTLFHHLQQLMRQDLELEALIGHLIDVICDILEKNPYLPNFLVNIINESSELTLFLAASQQDNLPAQLDKLLVDAAQKGSVSPTMRGEELILNIYALCALPYFALPYIKAKENRDEQTMLLFMRARKEQIKTFVLKGIKP